MIKNTTKYSDLYSWFLRGIEDRIKEYPYIKRGSFSKININDNNTDFIKPRSIVFLGTKKKITAVLTEKYNNAIYLFSGNSFTICGIIDFKNTNIFSLSNINNKLFVSTDKNTVIKIFFLDSYIKTNAESEDFNEIPVIEIDDLQIQEYEIKNVRLDYDIKFITWESKHNIYSFLAWKLFTPDLWFGELTDINNILTKTFFNIKNELYPDLKFSCACFQKGQQIIYISDSGTGRVFFIPLNERPLCGKNIIGDGIKRFQLGKALDTRLNSPSSLLIYDFSEINGDLRKLFKTNIKKGANLLDSKTTDNPYYNPFLVILDNETKIALTVSVPTDGNVFDRNSEILPLVGRLPEIIERPDQPTNLAKHPLNSIDNITLGPDGSILFWRIGSADMYFLDPQLEQILKLIKDREKTSSGYSTISLLPYT